MKGHCDETVECRENPKHPQLVRIQSEAIVIPVYFSGAYAHPIDLFST